MQGTVRSHWLMTVPMMSLALAALALGLSASTQGGVSPVEPGAELARIEDAGSSVLVAFEGFVFEPDGAPAEGAVVVSSAGGQAVADWHGCYRLEARVPIDAESLRITAVGRASRNLLASTSVGLPAAPGLVRVAPLWLEGSSCQPSWLPTFGGQPGTEYHVYALTVFDDGAGPALYAGGYFTSAGGVAATSRIAKWDGSNWAALGGGMDYIVNALTVFDDGGGPALYAGGLFTTAGGVAASQIAKWDGSSWAVLGTGMSGGSVNALTVFDDGGGPALYAGGQFATAGGVAARNIAKWDGSHWTALGTGLSGGSVASLMLFDDGGGPALYAGGSFTTAGGIAANRIAKWDGSSWAPLGSGVSWIPGPTPRVNALTVFDDGGGPALYAGGSFTIAGGVEARWIAKWDGSSWATPGNGMNLAVYALTEFDDGNGPALYAGGAFKIAGGVTADHIAKWDGSSWAALGSGIGGGVIVRPRVDALTVFDDGSGPALHAGGDFTTAGGVAASYIVKWDGSSWAALGSGTTPDVRALTVYDDGGGPALYAGGYFETAGGVMASAIARWDGSSWTALGSGLIGEEQSEFVSALTVYDDGGGPALHAGGFFTNAGAVSAHSIAKWDGLHWTALGSGMNEDVYALTVYDDGGGPALYAGGDFTTAGGVAASYIARWDGSSWAALGSGMNGSVGTLTVFDDGSGPALYAGGGFTTAGGVAANRIARWDGSSWAALGSGMNGGVGSLTVFDDGGGPALYAGGGFTTAGGVAANRIARWDGSSWAALGSGMNGGVGALTVFDDGSGPALYAGGGFTSAIDSEDSFLAKWGFSDTTPPTLSCPPGVLVIERGPPGEVVTFSVAASDDQGCTLSVVCVPPSGSFFPHGTTLVTCTATDASGNQATCQFPVTVDRPMKRRP